MQCPSCHAELDHDADRCASCGRRVVAPDPSDPSDLLGEVTTTPGWDLTPHPGDDPVDEAVDGGRGAREHVAGPDGEPVADPVADPDDDDAVDRAHGGDGRRAGPSEVHLGRFHPAVGERISGLLAHRRVGHRVRPTDDHVDVGIDPAWRDDVRAELAMNWSDLVRRLEPEVATEVLALGGSTPGWFDPPRGGHIDRAGRLVVDAGGNEDAETDANRVIGPGLLTFGAILVITGWQVVGSSALTVLGLALLVVGLFLPR